MQCENPGCPWWATSPPATATFERSLIEWPPAPLGPRPTFREPCWRFVGPSNRVLACAIVGVATGFEVQAVYEPGTDLLRTQLEQSLRDARIVAGQWREAVAAKGGFVALDFARVERYGGAGSGPH